MQAQEVQRALKKFQSTISALRLKQQVILKQLEERMKEKKVAVLKKKIDS